MGKSWTIVLALYPLLFQVIGDHQDDVAILLIQNGADVNALNNAKYTPVMYVAQTAKTSETWKHIWRLVRYMLEDAYADYTYTTPDGINLPGIIKDIQKEAKHNKIVMPPDFDAVVKWLESKKAYRSLFSCYSLNPSRSSNENYEGLILFLKLMRS